MYSNPESKTCHFVMNYNKIHPFYITNDDVLFFDIWIKNNQLYMILPCPVTNPIDINSIEVFEFDQILHIKSKFIYDYFENTSLIIYHPFENLKNYYNIKVKYKKFEKQYVIYDYMSIKNFTLTLSTLCKDDYKYFYPFYHYYKSQGVEYFFIYYNDNITRDVLIFFKKFDDVLLIEWNYTYWFNKKYGSHYAQPAQINHALYKYGKGFTEYMIFCDLDEYLQNKKSTLINLIRQQSRLNAIYFRNIWSKTIHPLNPLTLMHKRNILVGKPFNTMYRCKQIIRVDKIISTGIHHLREHLREPLYIKNASFDPDNLCYHFFQLTQPDRIVEDNVTNVIYLR